MEPDTGLQPCPLPGVQPVAVQQRCWETASTSSSGSDFQPIAVQRAISDPAPTSPKYIKAEDDSLRRCQSWPPVGGMQRRSSTVELLAAPFHDKARARVRAVEGGPVVSCGAFILWVVFGASGWWSTNAIASQLPLLTEVLPEKKALGNKLSAMAQGGNLFLATYMLLRRQVRMDPTVVIFIMMILGCTALGGCAMFWDCAFPPGESLPLLACAVVAGGVGCTSGVTYWTFLLLYPPRCTIAASVGMSLGGVLANLLAAVQFCGVGNNGARFGPTEFFALAAAIQLLGMASFLVVTRARLQDADGWSLHEPLSPNDELLGRVAGIRAKRVQETDEESDPIQRSRAAFCSLNFLVRGVTYLMPTLMPYVAGAYPELRMQLLFWMLLGQQLGETAGRALEPSPCGAAALGGLAVLDFSAFVVVACCPPVLSSWLPQAYAQLLIPAACTFYFLSYGMIETAIFKWIRGLSKRSLEVEDLSAMTGSCGQMGSLASTLLVFLCFELHVGGA